MEIYKVLRKQPCSWSLNDTLLWLELIEMKQYQESFRENSIDGSILMDLQDSDLLKELHIESEEDRNKMMTRIKEELPKIQALHNEKQEYEKYRVERIDSNASQKNEISEEVLKEIRLKLNIPNDWEICTDPKDWGWVTTDEENYFLSIYHYEYKENIQVQVKETSNQCDASIGRDPSQNQISTDHRYMDPVHAKIIYDKSEKIYWFIDCNTQYGSYIRINATQLNILDEIIVGNSVIQVNKIIKSDKNKESVQLELSVVTEKEPLKTIVIFLTKGNCKWIGRESTSDIVLDDKEVSKKHAYFSLNQSGVIIFDNNSKNMVWKKISKIQLNNPSESSQETLQLKLGREKFSFLVYKQKKQKYYKEISEWLK